MTHAGGIDCDEFVGLLNGPVKSRYATPEMMVQLRAHADACPPCQRLAIDGTVEIPKPEEDEEEGPKKFFASGDGELYQDGPYDSMEEAVREAPHDGSGDYGYESTFYVGRLLPPNLSGIIDTGEVIEDLVDRAGEECGEVAENWLDKVTLDQEKVLGQLMDGTIEGWLRANRFTPKFGKIVDVREFKHECKNEDDCDAFFVHKIDKPIPMILLCPACHEQHIDEGEWATKPHKVHKFLKCGQEWRPSKLHTVGVMALE